MSGHNNVFVEKKKSLNYPEYPLLSGTLFPHNICCDPSLELSHCDSSNAGSQHVFH